jgi:hypothetical protein
VEIAARVEHQNAPRVVPDHLKPEETPVGDGDGPIDPRSFLLPHNEWGHASPNAGVHCREAEPVSVEQPYTTRLGILRHASDV